MSSFAVVLLNYNGKSWLEKFLPALVRHTPEEFLYLIDNASADDSLEFLAKHYPNIQIISLKENKGFAGGYNEGLKYISADIYCLLNTDVEVTENWYQPILDGIEKHPNISAAQPKIRSFYQKDFFEFAGAAGGWIDVFGYPYCDGRSFSKTEKDEAQFETEKEIIWASGCCFFVRSKDFFDFGGFDEGFFAHQEEIDLCWRWRNAGKKIYYFPQSKIYHAGGGTLRTESPKKTFLNFRNNLLMLVKNLPISYLFPIIFTRLCLDGLAAIYLGFKNGPKHTFAVMKAHFGFYALLPKYLKKRTGKPVRKDYYKDFSMFFK